MYTIYLLFVPLILLVWFYAWRQYCAAAHEAGLGGGDFEASFDAMVASYDLAEREAKRRLYPRKPSKPKLPNLQLPNSQLPNLQSPESHPGDHAASQEQPTAAPPRKTRRSPAGQIQTDEHGVPYPPMSARQLAKFINFRKSLDLYFAKQGPSPFPTYVSRFSPTELLPEPATTSPHTFSPAKPLVTSTLLNTTFLTTALRGPSTWLTRAQHSFAVRPRLMNLARAISERALHSARALTGLAFTLKISAVAHTLGSIFFRHNRPSPPSPSGPESTPALGNLR